jgi:hypothetical protein
MYTSIYWYGWDLQVGFLKSKALGAHWSFEQS